MTNVSEPTLFRLRVAYPKLGRLKYLGHRELIHTVEQVVRRAKLPYAVTQGFSPHMRIAYTSALPVGTSSTAEYFAVYLTELIPAEDALARLQDAAPVDLRPIDAAYVELRRPALTAEINKVRYLLEVFVRPEFAVTDDALSQVVFGWYDRGAQIPFHRGKKTKTLDVRRLLKAEGTKYWQTAASESNCARVATMKGRFAPRSSWPPSTRPCEGSIPVWTRRSCPREFSSSRCSIDIMSSVFPKAFAWMARLSSSHWAVSSGHLRGAFSRVPCDRLCRTCEYAGKTR